MEVWKRKNKAGNILKQGSGSLAIVSPEAYPIPSVYGIFNYIWLLLMVNAGKYTIHAWYGYNTEILSPCFHVGPPMCYASLLQTPDDNHIIVITDAESRADLF